MRRIAKILFPWVPWAVSMILSGLGIWLLVLSPDAPVGPHWGPRGFSAAFALSFSTVGAFVFSRHPRNAVGWLMVWVGLLSGLQVFAEEYAAYALLAVPGTLPGGEVAAWIAAWIWVPTAGPALTLLPLVFPDGHLPSSKWRPAASLAVGAILILAGGIAVAPGPLENFTYQENPFGLAAAAVLQTQTYQLAANTPLLIAVLLSVTALLLRFRRSTGQPRQQLKWFVFSGALAGLALLPSFLGFALTSSQIGPMVMILALIGIPISMGIAILRHRLYDIDLIVNRTLVYSALTGVLAAVYFATVAILQATFRAIAGQDSQLAIVVSTLAIAALFTPLRRRIQEAVDRRFYRSKYDAAHMLASFASTARDEMDAEQLVASLLKTVEESLQPVHVSLWLTPQALTTPEGPR